MSEQTIVTGEPFVKSDVVFMKKIPIPTIFERKCSECDACCYVLEVRELSKESYCDCSHRKSGGGCSIWTDPLRPDVCGQWNCGWLLGWLSEEDRPDKSGIVFYPVAAHLTEVGLAHVAGQEVWSGALDAPAGQKAFSALASKILTVVRLFGTQVFRAAGPGVEIWRDKVGA